jgi:hypothetical protein
MVSLHLLQYLQEGGFGTLETSLFFEKLPLGKTGIAIFSRGGERAYGRKLAAQNFDLYSRGSSDLLGYDKLEKIAEYFANNYDNLCQLPIIQNVSNRLYKKARITTIGNIENIGLDENDRVIFRLGATIIYEKP